METRITQHRREVIELPKTENIRSFSNFLDKQIDKNYKLLSKKFNSDPWRNLAEALLSQLRLFNRKRASEIERLELDDHKNIKFVTNKDEGYSLLSQAEKEAAKE